MLVRRQSVQHSDASPFATLRGWPYGPRDAREPPLCADIGIMPIKTRAIQIWEFCVPRAGGDGDRWPASWVRQTRAGNRFEPALRPAWRRIPVRLRRQPEGGYRSVIKVTA
jgi:hypothetical protein